MANVSGRVYGWAFAFAAMLFSAGVAIGQTTQPADAAGKYVKTNVPAIDAAPPGTRGVIHIDMKEVAKSFDKIWDTVEQIGGKGSIPLSKVEVSSLVGKIDTADIYIMQAMNQPVPLAVIHGKLNIDDIKAVLKSVGMDTDKCVTEDPKKKGHYFVNGLVSIVDGSQADDVDDGVMLIGAGDASAVKLNNGVSKTLAELVPQIDVKAPIWGMYMYETYGMPVEGKAPEKVYLSYTMSLCPMSSTASSFKMSCPDTELMKRILTKVDSELADVLKLFEKTVTDNEMSLKFTLDGTMFEKFSAALAQARVNAKKAASQSNLRAIGMAIALYKGEFDKMPESLLILVERRSIGPNGLVSPLSGRKPPQDPSELATFKSDYVYLPVTEERADLVIAYEPVSINNGEGGNMLMADGNPTWMKAEDHAKAIKRTLEWMKEKGIAIPAEATSQPTSTPASAPAK